MFHVLNQRLKNSKIVLIQKIKKNIKANKYKNNRKNRNISVLQTNGASVVK